MKASFPSRRRIALCVAGVQLFAVAHMALVDHTSGLEGTVAGVASSMEQHLDAAMHVGDHAHAAAPHSLRQAEETCDVASLLRDSVDGLVAVKKVELPVPRLVEPAAGPGAPPGSRLERLLAAPKASPPRFAEA